jgi:hypothetical protein
MKHMACGTGLSFCELVNISLHLEPEAAAISINPLSKEGALTTLPSMGLGTWEESE